MEFTFKRDDEGRESIYCKGVKVGEVVQGGAMRSARITQVWLNVPGVTIEHINDAIERAEEAGFWDYGFSLRKWSHDEWAHDEVTVDVPIAETTVLSVTLEGDES